MYYYEAPQRVPPEEDFRPSVFMAGGISNCPDWHTALRERLTSCDLTLLNPRRANFPMDDPNAAQEQIVWEYEHLRAATAILFWFPAETLCPITLFELGAWSHWQGQRYDAEAQEHKLFRKPIFVGVHPDYPRRQDVEIQLRLQRPEAEIVFTLDELARQIEQWLSGIETPYQTGKRTAGVGQS